MDVLHTAPASTLLLDRWDYHTTHTHNPYIHSFPGRIESAILILVGSHKHHQRTSERSHHILQPSRPVAGTILGTITFRNFLCDGCQIWHRGRKDELLEDLAFGATKVASLHVMYENGNTEPKSPS